MPLRFYSSVCHNVSFDNSSLHLKGTNGHPAGQNSGCLPSCNGNQWQLTMRGVKWPRWFCLIQCVVFSEVEPFATMPCLWAQANEPHCASNQIHMGLTGCCRVKKTARSMPVYVVGLTPLLQLMLHLKNLKLLWAMFVCSQQVKWPYVEKELTGNGSSQNVSLTAKSTTQHIFITINLDANYR